MHVTASSYLTEMHFGCCQHYGRRNLRSATHGDLLMPRSYGPRSFTVTVWNDLPPTLRASPGTLRQFQSTLKTILFCSAYRTRFCALVTVSAVRTTRYKFTYLLTYLLTY